jgi:hypothetical protein
VTINKGADNNRHKCSEFDGIRKKNKKKCIGCHNLAIGSTSLSLFSSIKLLKKKIK